MNVAEFQKLKIDEVIYNKETSEIVITTSQFTQDKTEVNPDDALTTRSYDGASASSIKASECEAWDLMSDSAPDNVKLQICLIRLASLEHFVYSRLR